MSTEEYVDTHFRKLLYPLNYMHVSIGGDTHWGGGGGGGGGS